MSETPIAPLEQRSSASVSVPDRITAEMQQFYAHSSAEVTTNQDRLHLEVEEVPQPGYWDQVTQENDNVYSVPFEQPREKTHAEVVGEQMEALTPPQQVARIKHISDLVNEVRSLAA